MEERKQIVVLIPCYEEEKSIAAVIRGVKQNLKGYKFAVVVINDGSTDDTKLLAESEGANVISHRKQFGLAEAYRTGCRTALKNNADIIITMDGDGQYDAKSIPQLLSPVIRGEADLVLGWRKHKKYMPLSKKMGNWLFSRVISSICREKINDSQTGFRAFTKEIAAFDILSDFSYTQETIIRALRNGFRVLEVPINFAKREHGKSRLFSNPFSYALRAWINLFRIFIMYAPIRFFGIIGLLLIFSSLPIGLILGHDLLSLGAFLVGVQILIFGLLADLFTKIIHKRQGK